MAIAILNQGKTAIRDALAALITHVAITDDNTAFVLTQTGINPAAADKDTHVEAVSETIIDGNTIDYTITVTGVSEFTNSSIFAIGVSKGLGVRQATGAGGSHTGGAIVGTDTLTRSVRTLGIGVESGDTFTIGVRITVQDNS